MPSVHEGASKAVNCPSCNGTLERTFNEAGSYWICPKCHGRAIGLAVLRRVVRKNYVDHVWGRARDNAGGAGQPCAFCHRAMLEISILEDDRPVRLDVCRSCEMVWFDPKEFDLAPIAIAAAPAKAAPDYLPQEAREKIAIYQAQMVAEDQPPDFSPDATWKTVPALFGFPVQADPAPMTATPWMTWSLAALVTLISVLAFPNLERAIDDLGFVPAEAFRSGGVTFITSFFLHGGVMHLVGNMYFLIVFGAAVENVLGKWEWLVLVMLSTLAGDLLHWFVNMHSEIPCIGASGGISGLIAFYALRFPKSKISFLAVMYGRWLQLPAWAAFALWVLLQCVQIMIQWGRPGGGVANFAHLGGALAGFGLWLRYRNSLSPAGATPSRT